ncbi:hypothetical protein [uncultured Tenacibaculum sp.]|uniref:hypothetical protein n=1 Tax=uncultured Tenacibaculum sp. TaxID=174713 RepID=UPI0026344D97|nr:hypothetical protein [uncultured Tenacibaculum sp.]
MTSIFKKLGSIIQPVINFLDGLEKASKTLEAFNSSFKMFNEERKQIWSTPKVEVKPQETKENEPDTTTIQTGDTE